ncbi:hypothetical protein JTB14_019887 [Gonioctena quinquepunctata]|nr:hypothetical protein JTB14_019887 [Gonioctena quinquepunctata]
MNSKYIAILFLSSFANVHSLDNGLALTPPMGWMHWQRFRCLIDCDIFPDECVSERLFRTMANHLVSDGYLEAGYEYIIIDDCWASKNRTSEGRLQPDPLRFPSGMKNLSDYVRIFHEFGYECSHAYFMCK